MESKQPSQNRALVPLFIGSTVDWWIIAIDMSLQVTGVTLKYNK
jgi:hypothetical protein